MAQLSYSLVIVKGIAVSYDWLAWVMCSPLPVCSQSHAKDTVVNWLGSSLQGDWGVSVFFIVEGCGQEFQGLVQNENQVLNQEMNGKP